MSGVALVIGGGSGIGAAAATQLALQGKVAVADLDAVAAERVAAGLPGDGHWALGCDIADESSVRSCFEQVESGLGGVRVLAITAGVAGLIGGTKPSICETSLESWSSVMDVNATGPFLAIREMIERRRKMPVADGRIITLSSVSGQSASHTAAISYAASKAAILAMTRVAAAESEPLGMTANAIAPGMVDTPMLRSVFENGDLKLAEPLGPIGQPDDIAAIIGFLASPAARFINGACIDANGGYAMR